MPAKHADALAGEVAIRAKVDQTGLTVAGKSRALMAADQLLGGLIGIPGGWFEGIRRRNELRRDARERFLEADIAKAMRQVEGLSELGQSTMQRVLRDEYRKQENRASVWVAAEEQLALPPHDQPCSDEPSPADEGEEIDADWLNRFTSFAQDVSNEELQRVWGRVLAGEIRKPGQFSISSLRILSELEADIARSFEEIYRNSVNGFAARPEKLEGAALERLAVMDHAGLVQVDTFLRYRVFKADDGFGYLMGNRYLLRVTFPPNASETAFSAIRITRVGMQLGTILERDEVSGLREIAQAMTPAERIELGVVRTRSGNQFTWDFVETVPPKR